MATPVTPPALPVHAPAQNSDALPCPAVLLQASKLSIELDRPIQLDYYKQTAVNTAFIGEDTNEPAPGKEKDRILVKSKEEFTSFIKKLYKVDNKVGDKVVGSDFIVLTENSLYVISGKVQKRRLNLASLHNDED